MRSFVLVLCLALVAVACGDDDVADPTTTTAATTTTSSTTTTEATTTTTTTLAPIPTVADLCVIGLAPGETTEVHAGVGADTELLGALAHDATGVGATGVTATNDADEEWVEIAFEGQAAWVDSRFLTGGPCDVGEAGTWAVFDIQCNSFLNVRNGHGDGYDILGQLAADDFDLAGTGVTALDDQDRLWVQIEFDGGTAWVAGWFLTEDPGPTVDCSVWIITANAVGPIELGDPGANLEAVTGLGFYLQNSAGDCDWFSDDDDRVGVEVVAGVITEIWVFDPDIAATVEGFRVGDSKADAGSLYFGRATLLPGPIVPSVTNIVIDGPNYGNNWTYLFIEDPFDNDAIGTIRISPDGGYIEGGCT